VYSESSEFIDEWGALWFAKLLVLLEFDGFLSLICHVSVAGSAVVVG
jgi:hypothetical protein